MYMYKNQTNRAKIKRIHSTRTLVISKHPFTTSFQIGGWVPESKTWSLDLNGATDMSVNRA